MHHDLKRITKLDYHGVPYEATVLDIPAPKTKEELWKEVRPLLFRDHGGSMPTKERLETIHLIENKIV